MRATSTQMRSRNVVVLVLKTIKIPILIKICSGKLLAKLILIVEIRTGMRMAMWQWLATGALTWIALVSRRQPKAESRDYAPQYYSKWRRTRSSRNTLTPPRTRMKKMWIWISQLGDRFQPLDLKAWI